MYPTFKPGQILHINTRACDIGPGDIIVFLHQSQGRLTVHRVVKAGREGFITRGDNNRRYDDSPIALVHVLGRIEYLEHKGKVRRVKGREFGLLYARYRWSLLLMKCCMRRFVSLPYRTAKASKIRTSSQ